MSPLLTRTPPGGPPGRESHRFDEPRALARALFRILPGLGVVLACLLLGAPARREQEAGAPRAHDMERCKARAVLTLDARATPALAAPLTHCEKINNVES